jgi:hypothetical protein
MKLNVSLIVIIPKAMVRFRILVRFRLKFRVLVGFPSILG